VAPEGVELEEGDQGHDQELEDEPERPPRAAAQQRERFVFRSLRPIARTFERSASGGKRSAVSANPGDA
jgi:hypothetical protein